MKPSRLTDAIQNTASKSMPKRNTSPKIKPPWWSEELLKRIKKLKTTARKRLANQDCRILKEEYRNARNQFTSQLRIERINSWRSYCTTNGAKPWGKLHKWLRKGSLSHKIPTSVQKEDGTFTSSLEVSAAKILKVLISNDPAQVPYNHNTTSNNYSFVACTEDELKESVWKINPRNAPGNDGLTADIIRKAWPYIKEHNLNIINHCLRTGIFTDCRKSAGVVLIKKSKEADPTIPKSYRPISLLPVLGKGLERVICSRLLEKTTHNMNNCQYGFVKGKLTVDAIRDLLN